MFTGIIESVGKIAALKRKENELEIELYQEKPFENLILGASVAIDGMCVTVTKITKNGFAFYLSPESLAKTISSNYQLGTIVNLERPVVLGGRLDGHYVTGHVDGVLILLEVEKIGESHKLKLSIPQENNRFFVDKGAVTLNGVSLTVNEVKDDYFTVNLIPHTYELTNFNNLKAKDSVNYEVDILAKYFVKQI